MLPRGGSARSVSYKGSLDRRSSVLGRAMGLKRGPSAVAHPFSTNPHTQPNPERRRDEHRYDRSCGQETSYSPERPIHLVTEREPEQYTNYRNAKRTAHDALVAAVALLCGRLLTHFAMICEAA